MPFNWSAEKSERNRRERGKGFEEAERLFDDVYAKREVLAKGEKRTIIYGYLDGHEWVGVFSLDRSEARIISLRRANKRERGRFYEQGQEN